MSSTKRSGALCAAKWPPWSYIVQRTMLLWSRSANRRMPLKSPPKPARAIVTGVGVLPIQPCGRRRGARDPVERDVGDLELGLEVLAQQLCLPCEQPER